MTDNIQTSLMTITKENKYTKWYINIISNNNSCGDDGYSEKHHIIPKSLHHLLPVEILKSSDNIVKLSARCHFIAHLLLTKMFTDKIARQKMNYAFFQMRIKNKHQTNRYINSKFYETKKKDKIKYIRFYLGAQVHYVNELDHVGRSEMIRSGMSSIMTDEYKQGRVGNMLGRRHSEQTKIQMSKSSLNIPKLWLHGREMSDDTKQKIRNTKLHNELQNPELYRETRRKTSEKMKLKYKTGELSVKGVKNPRYDVKLSDDSRRKFSEQIERRKNNGFTHLEICQNIIIPELEKHPMTITEILNLINCKWRPHYIRNLVKQLNPDFDMSRIKRNPISRTTEHTKKHSEALQRKFNNGFSYEELYNQFIVHNLSEVTKIEDIMDEHNLSMKSLRIIIKRFHPNGEQFWNQLIKYNQKIS